MNVDQAARDMAQKALNKIEKHEAVCAVRDVASDTWQKDTTFKLSGISKSISSLYGRLWMGASGLVGVLLAIIAYLLTHPHAGF